MNDMKTLVILMFIALLGITLSEEKITQLLWIFIWAICFCIWLYKIAKREERGEM